MWRAPLIVLAAMLGFGVSACGGAETVPHSNKGGASLRVVHVVDPSGGLYVEGSIWHLRIVDSAEDEVLDGNPKGDRASLELERGRYRLESYERPCDGTCSHLDPPVDACSRELTAERGKTVAIRITVRPAKGCTIAVRG